MWARCSQAASWRDGNEPLLPLPLTGQTPDSHLRSPSLAAPLLKLSFFFPTGGSLHCIHASISLCTYMVLISTVPESQGPPGHCLLFFAAIVLEFINRKAACETHEVSLPFPITKASAGVLPPSLVTVHQEGEAPTGRSPEDSNKSDQRCRKQPLRRDGGKWVH